MTEQIQINRQAIYLTIDNVRIETEKGIEAQENQFVGYFKNEPPTEIIFGEKIKDINGEDMIFHSLEDAKSRAVEMLINRIYPPSYLRPLEYTIENISEIMHKELIFEVGNFNGGEVEENIRGIMTKCTLTSNPPLLPASVRIMTNEGERRLSIMEIKGIRRQ